MKKRILGFAKYPIALLILYWVLQAADWDAIQTHVKAISPPLLIAAILCFTLAQMASALRMNAYYRHMGKPLSFAYGIRLYYVALFYNVILPGGIGGDAYKVYLLKKQMDYPIGEGIRIQLATRTNGLLVLLLSLYLTLPFMGLPFPMPLILAAVLLSCACTIIGYAILSRMLLKEVSRMEWRALPYSVGVQGFNILCMICLWAALSDGAQLIPYVFLFQLAAIAGMIPISIGGLGIREFTFFYGATLIGQLTGTALDPELGVVISLLVFAITVISALIGLLWIERIQQMSPCATPPR